MRYKICTNVDCTNTEMYDIEDDVTQCPECASILVERNESDQEYLEDDEDDEAEVDDDSDDDDDDDIIDADIDNDPVID